jgi:type I restriction enzyme S subunit
VEWLGEVPAHWEVAPGRRWFTQSREPASTGDAQLSATQKYGVVPQAHFMEAEDQKVALALSGLGSFKHVESGDFVISLRSFQGGIERSEHRGCVSPAYTVLRPHASMHGAFCRYLLKSEGYVHALQAMTDGIRDGKSISYQQFGQVVVPAPPRSEQINLAHFLDHETAKIDGLISEQERLLDLLKEKRQAVISHAVTKGLNPNAPMKPSGIDWLGDVPAHWGVLTIRSVSTFMTSGPRGWSDRIGDEGALFVQSGDLDDAQGVAFGSAKRVIVAKDAEATRTRIAAGDVLVCITGANTGKVAVCRAIPEPAHINQHLCLVRPELKVDSQFLALVLASWVGQTYFDLAQYGLKQGLSLAGVANAPVPLPPSNEQRAIVALVADAVETLASLTAEAQAAIGILTERRAALISSAVTGQIDVRGAAERQSA